MADFIYPSLSFAQEELVLLLKLFDATTIPGMGKEPLAGLSEEQQKLLLSSAERNLKARGVLAVPNHEQIHVDQFTIALIGPCVFPEYSILISQIILGQEPRSHYFHHGNRMVIEHFLSDLALHTFVALPGRVAVEQRLMTLLEFSTVKASATAKGFQMSINGFQKELALLFSGEEKERIQHSYKQMRGADDVFFGAMHDFKGLSSMIFIDHHNLEESISLDLLHTEGDLWQVRRMAEVVEINRLTSQEFREMIAKLLKTFPQGARSRIVGV